jgi:hypothetical protein
MASHTIGIEGGRELVWGCECEWREGVELVWTVGSTRKPARGSADEFDLLADYDQSETTCWTNSRSAATRLVALGCEPAVAARLIREAAEEVTIGTAAGWRP